MDIVRLIVMLILFLSSHNAYSQKNTTMNCDESKIYVWLNDDLRPKPKFDIISLQNRILEFISENKKPKNLNGEYITKFIIDCNGRAKELNNIVNYIEPEDLDMLIVEFLKDAKWEAATYNNFIVPHRGIVKLILRKGKIMALSIR